MNGGEWVGIGDGAYSYLEHSVMHNNFIGRNYQKYLNEIKQNQICTKCNFTDDLGYFIDGKKRCF